MPAADNSGSVGGGGLNSGSSDVSGGEGSAGGLVPMEDETAASSSPTATAPSAFLKRVTGKVDCMSQLTQVNLSQFMTQVRFSDSFNTK